jgi:FkbM family methyltransferase
MFLKLLAALAIRLDGGLLWLQRFFWKHRFRGAGLAHRGIRCFRAAILLPSDGVLCRMEDGFLMSLRPRRDALECSMFLDRTYEQATLAFMAQVIRPGDTVLDVGANIGLMTLRASQLVGDTGSVYAFEPHPETFRRLELNVRLNAASNVIALELALGDAPARRELFDFPKASSGRASLVGAPGGVPAASVGVARLDEVLTSRRVSSVRFLKLDVEGFELQVLGGALDLLRSRPAPIVCMEVSRALPVERGDALSAHRFMLSVDHYVPFRFVEGKGRPSPLVPVLEEALIPAHENVIYMTREAIDTVPAKLFRHPLQGQGYP